VEIPASNKLVKLCRSKLIWPENLMNQRGRDEKRNIVFFQTTDLTLRSLLPQPGRAVLQADNIVFFLQSFLATDEH